MRTITKDIQLNIDGNSENFRLTKPDAFSGVEILWLLYLKALITKRQDFR
jgi:hypothetical protein